MRRRNGDSLKLLIGDIAIFFISLWLMLIVRHLSIPSIDLYYQHVLPFSVLFTVWIVVYFIAGLYERHTVMFQQELPPLLFRTQIFNVLLAVLFFYLIPYFTITPKTNLFIYLVLSFGFILLWRLYGYGFIGSRKKMPALLIGSGEELYELRDEYDQNPYSDLSIALMIDLDNIGTIDLQRDLIEPVYSEGIVVAAVELRHSSIDPLLPHLYNFIFSNVTFFDIHRLYEETFKRVPFSLLHYSWFLENVSGAPRILYDSLKRLIDILVALLIGVVFLPFFPFVVLAIKLSDGGTIFFSHERIGKNNQPFKLIKFRTMQGKRLDGSNDHRRITPVGRFLRISRIDEIPQIWNILRGELSFIGPRPEIPEYVQEYKKQIPFYNIRHLIKPGLSGWAQIYQRTPPRHVTDVEETRRKLSYDLYYITHRSLILDIVICLKTVKALIMKVGAS